MRNIEAGRRWRLSAAGRCAVFSAIVVAAFLPALAGAQETQPTAPSPGDIPTTSAPAQSNPSPSTKPQTVVVPSSPQPSTDATVAGPVAASLPAPSALPHDLSPWSMFMNADIVVKAVMVGLAFASLVTWTVWLAKGVELFAAMRRAKSAARKLEQADSLADASRAIAEGWTRHGSVAELASTAMRESKRSGDLSAEGVKERSAIALSRIEARSGRNMAKGTGLLATIGATAPFVGLFGTVWGIMNSFIGISQAHTTNLAVVAPGIAEALLATAIGLVAAIPAVVFYNVFSRSIAGYRAILSDASGEVLQHLSRDLERQERGGGAAGDLVMRPALHAAAARPQPAE